jgi:hypothetical protein
MSGDISHSCIFHYVVSIFQSSNLSLLNDAALALSTNLQISLLPIHQEVPFDVGCLICPVNHI